MLISVWQYRHTCKVVLIDCFSTQAFWFAYSVGKFCKLLAIPYIPIVRGGDFINRLTRSKKECDFLFTCSYITIVPSKFLEFHFNQARYKVTYIPNFLELQKYPFKLREHVQPRILWVRAFHKIYNPVLAVNVLAQLNRSDATLCMVGADTDGIRKIVEERIAKLGLMGRVTLPGRLLKDEWTDLSKQYDIFINTTTIDNMPVSVIEAMALGLPVVSTNVGGIPYLLENGRDGILVASNDAEGMCKAILELLHNSDLTKKISTEARKKVEEFDWDKVKLKWFEVLDQLVKPVH
jgi:glycosyltransferase involved in cell wall biosynthesis